MDSEKEPVEEPHKQPPSSPGIWNRLFRWFLGFLSFLFILLLAVQAIFWVYTDEIVGNALKQLVLTKSKGLYFIGYDNIELNVLTGNLDIREFYLKADSSHYDRINKRWFTENKVYEVEVSDVNVKGAHIAEVYFKDQLNIDKISIKEPTVSIYNYLIDTLRSDELKANNFFYLISDYLKLFRIEDFNVEYGSVGIEHYNDSIKLYQTLENISLNVDGFQIDSTSHLKDGRPFNVNDIAFEIEYNTFNVKGIPYELKIGNIKGGTKEQSLNLKNIFLTPWETAKNKNQLSQLHIPELDITGLNYRKAYFNNIIEINKVAFNTPKANIKSLVLPKQRSQSSIADSVNYLKIFKSLSIDTISLNEGNVLVNTKYKKNKIHIPLSNISLSLSDFHVDSTTDSNSLIRKLLFKEADLKLKNFEMRLADSLHRLGIRELYISTKNRRIYGRGMRVYPRYRKSQSYALKRYKKNKLYDISLPYFGISNIDIFKTYFQRKFEANNVNFFMPDVHLVMHPEIETNDTVSFDVKNIYPLISPYMRYLKIKNFKIDKGAVKITSHDRPDEHQLFMKSFDLKMNQILLDTGIHFNEDNLFFSSGFQFSASDVIHFTKDSLQKLLINQVFLSSEDSSFSLKGLHFNPLVNLAESDSIVLGKDLLDLNLNSIQVSRLDINKALNEQVFIIDSLKVFQGDSRLYKSNLGEEITITQVDSLAFQNSSLTDYFKFAKIKELEIENVSFESYAPLKFKNAKYSLDSITAYMQNINVDGYALADSLWSMADSVMIDSVNIITDHSEAFRLNHAVLLGKNLRIPLSDSSHHLLEIKEIGTATLWKSLFAEGIRVKPDTLIDEKTNNIYEIAIPYVWVDSIDLREFYYHKKLEAKQVSLIEPFALIDIIKNKQHNKKPIQLENLYGLIKDQLDLISINQLNIEEAGVDLLIKSDNKTQNFYSNDVEIQMKNFILDSTSHLTPNRFLYSDDISFRVRDYAQTFSDSLHSLEVDKIVFSSSDSKLKIENLGLYPEFELNANGPKSSNLYDIYIPTIEIDTFNLYNFYMNNDLGVSKVNINAPKLNLNLHASKTGSSKSFEPKNWYGVLAPYLTKLNIKDFKFNDLELGITHSNDSLTEVTQLDNINGEIKSFLLDSTAKHSSGNLMYANDISLTLDNYSFMLPDSMYLVKIGKIGFSTDKSEIYFDDVSMEPLYDKFEFAYMIGHETDYMDFSSDRITFKEIDLYKLMEEEEFRTKSLIIDGFNGRLFRDKRLPPDENWYPPTPQQALIKMPYTMNIDTFVFRNGYVAYEEFAANGIAPGEIFFSDFNMTAYNITNDPVLLKQGIAVNIYASCYVMGEGLLQSSLNFPLTDPYGSFSYKGTVQKMDITKLNPILENIAFVKVVSGTNNKLAFNINANDHYSKGMVRFYYDDFKIDIINARKSDVEPKKRAMISFFANAVLNNKNPRLLFLKKGKVYYERNNRRSVFHYLVHSLLSGIRPSVGLSSKSKIPKGERKYDKAEFGE